MQLLRKYLFLWFLLSLANYTYSQQETDSLEQLISNSNDPHEQIIILEKAFDFYSEKDESKLLPIARKSVKLAEDYSQKDLPRTLNLLGFYFLNADKPDSAMVYFQQSLDYCLLRKDSIYLAKTYNNLGVLQFMSDEYEEGLSYFEQSANIELNLGLKSEASLSFNNLGGIYLMLNDIEKAEIYLQKGLSLARQTEDHNLIAHSYINLGSMETMRDQIMLAKKYYFQAIDLYKENRDWQGVSDTYGNLAVLYEEVGNPAMALKYNNLSIKYLNKLSNPLAKDLRNAYQRAAESFEQQHQYREAVEYYKLYIAWNDTVVNRANRKILIDAQEKYNSERTERENKLLAQKNIIHQLELEKQNDELIRSRFYIYSAVVGLILLIAFLLVLFNRNNLRKKANAKLTKANQIISEANKHISDSIHYASNIQRALLPPSTISIFDEAFIMLLPKDVVSGDFYWYSEINGIKIIAVVDCTGHGVPGAFMSMIGNTFLNEIVNERHITEPQHILGLLREKVVAALNQRDEEKWRDGMDVAICCIHEATNKVYFAGANNPVYAIIGGEFKEVKGDRQPVGYLNDNSQPFSKHEFSYSKGDTIYLFSDGFPDQFGGDKGKKYRYARFREFLFKIHTEPMSKQLDILQREFHDWKGDLEQIDDVCLLGVRL